jgi:hypothetical protein
VRLAALTCAGVSGLPAGGQVEIGWATDVAAYAYADLRRNARWAGAPPIVGRYSDGGGLMGATRRFQRHPGAGGLRVAIARSLRRAGGTPVRIRLAMSDGPAPMVVVRASNPHRLVAPWLTLLRTRRVIGSLLMIEDPHGYVRMVVGIVPNGSYTWAD